ncbi:MAG: 50S ribosome-binding GTPase, partial [Anaerolineae bacterium]|nr:50S ribosome-binding GTPase [Anaerolineae bacterium]
GTVVLFSDTVGFIQKLPTTLVVAFQATLEEISEADLILHVIDITHPNVHAQAEAVLNTLEDIGADHIPLLSVLNKVDNLSDPRAAAEVLEDFDGAVAISALKNKGIDELLSAIYQKMYASYMPISVLLPFNEGALIALFHEQGRVDILEHTRKGVKINGRVPGRLFARYKPFEFTEELEIF